MTLRFVMCHSRSSRCRADIGASMRTLFGSLFQTSGLSKSDASLMHTMALKKISN